MTLVFQFPSNAMPVRVKVRIAEAQRFMMECFLKVMVPEKDAKLQTEMLLQADRLGRLNHGLNRIGFYIHDIRIGSMKPRNEPVVVKECASVALVDAKNVLGATSSEFAMNIAINKAKATGVGWVTVRGANHNGTTSFWAQRAAKEGLIGLCFSNTYPVLVPTRSKQAALGANPLSVVAPGSGGELFFLDIALTAVTIHQIKLKQQKGEPLPSGWAQGPDGSITKDPEVALKTVCLLPLGGLETTGGYKGYGLSAMVEVFCGISSGALFAHHTRELKLRGDGRPYNLGHCFAAVDPNCFAPGFGDRLAEIITYWRNMEPVDPSKPVLAPGDLEREIAKETDKRGYILYLKRSIDNLAPLAKRLKVQQIEDDGEIKDKL